MLGNVKVWGDRYMFWQLARACLFLCRHTVPLIICCISGTHVSLAPVLVICSAILSASCLYFNPHGHVFTVSLMLSTAAARVGSVTSLHFANTSVQQHTWSWWRAFRESWLRAGTQPAKICNRIIAMYWNGEYFVKTRQVHKSSYMCWTHTYVNSNSTSHCTFVSALSFSWTFNGDWNSWGEITHTFECISAFIGCSKEGYEARPEHQKQLHGHTSGEDSKPSHFKNKITSIARGRIFFLLELLPQVSPSAFCRRPVTSRVTPTKTFSEKPPHISISLVPHYPVFIHIARYRHNYFVHQTANYNAVCETVKCQSIRITLRNRKKKGMRKKPRLSTQFLY